MYSSYRNVFLMTKTLWWILVLYRNFDLIALYSLQVNLAGGRVKQGTHLSDTGKGTRTLLQTCSGPKLPEPPGTSKNYLKHSNVHKHYTMMIQHNSFFEREIPLSKFRSPLDYCRIYKANFQILASLLTSYPPWETYLLLKLHTVRSASSHCCCVVWVCLPEGNTRIPGGNTQSGARTRTCDNSCHSSLHQHTREGANP